jgi:hypothetical protein
MARTIVDSNLKDRTARGRLKARRKPYWREIEPNLRRLPPAEGPQESASWAGHVVGAALCRRRRLRGRKDRRRR